VNEGFGTSLDAQAEAERELFVIERKAAPQALCLHMAKVTEEKHNPRPLRS
jgi:hypothetical protein